MTTYSQEDIENFHNKDKRISFLSIMSSLCNKVQHKEVDTTEIFNAAIKLNDELYKKYPFVNREIPIEPVARDTFEKTIKGNNDAPYCDTCGAKMRYVKAGISKKTGKQYNAFYSCITKGHPTKQAQSEADNAEAEHIDSIFDQASHTSQENY